MTFAQTEFKKGYIVNNQHERIDCQIRNAGNDESTKNYEFRLKEGGEIQKIALSQIEEFGIDNLLKCIRALIVIDVSPIYIESEKDIKAKWEEGHAYLETLFEGKLASLYYYYNDGKHLFFYSLADNIIKPLIHKTYYIGKTPEIYQLHQKISIDNTYKDQLKEYLACDDSNDAYKTKYIKKDLVEYFKNYHNCKNFDYNQIYSTQTKKGKIFIKPGIFLNRNQLVITDPPKEKFIIKNSVGFGVNAEYILPFNNNVWSVFTEANYLSYSTDKTSVDFENPVMTEGYIINYKTIEIPVGLSLNINFNRSHKFYVKAAYVPQVILGGSYISFKENKKESFSNSSRFLIGVGYNYQNWGVELRYYTPQNLTPNLYKQNSDFTHLSMKFSYSFQLYGDK